jgi:hypothetical protein
MSIWKNKHVVIATIVAPILAVFAYFGIGAIFGEKPQPAEPGQVYELIEKPNCRYASGECGLKNVDFELTLTGEPVSGGRYLLNVVSANPLDGIKLALAENGAEEEQPVDMRPVGRDGLKWTLAIKLPDPLHDRLHLVAMAGGTLYYADAATKFTVPESASEQQK